MDLTKVDYIQLHKTTAHNLDEEDSRKNRIAVIKEELELAFGHTPPERYTISMRSEGNSLCIPMSKKLDKLTEMENVLGNGKGMDISIEDHCRWPWNRLPRKET